MTSTKSFSISKIAVWNAFRQVKANRGAAGVDEVSIALFEQHLQRNLYKIWNRMSSGSYLPPPVKQVEIPKQKGGMRKLGIPTVADRIAQTVVKLYIEPKLDLLFHPDSYGYRPGKSAKDAVAVTRKRCWKYDWVVEFDIKGAFDKIDHALLTKAVKHHVKDEWILLYIERWLTAPFETAEGTIIPRDRGTPLRAGNLDEPSSIQPSMNIWADSAPSWACLDLALERVEQQPAPPKPSPAGQG